jgi:hypothetical protein
MSRLPRYQENTRVASNLPQFDFSSLKESVRVSQSLTSSLDRVSKFAFEQTAKATEKAAEQFTINNKLTLEQIQEAAKSGIKPEDLIAASGGGQIWQDTVTKIQGEQLRIQLEMLGKQELMNLQTQVDTGQITNITDVQAKQEAIVNGLRRSLSFAPESVIRFDTTMGVAAAANYKANQDKLSKDYKAAQQLLAEQDQRNTLEIFKNQLNNGDITDYKTLTKIQDAIEQQVFLTSNSGGSEFALSLAKDARKKSEELVINQLSKIALDQTFAKDAREALNKIKEGNFLLEDGRNYSDIYKNMSVENQAKIRDAVRKEFIDINRTEKEVEEANIVIEKEKVNNLEIKYYETKNPRILDEITAISRRTGGRAVTAATIESIKNSGKANESDIKYSDNVVKMLNEIKNGKFDSLEVLYARGELLGINRQAINKYVVPSFLNKSDALVSELIYNYSVSTNRTGSTARRVQTQTALHQEVSDAYQAQLDKPGVDLSKIKSKAIIAGELIDKKLNFTTKDMSRVKELNELGAKYNLNSFTAFSKLDEYLIQDLERKVKNKNDLEKIKQLLRDGE